MADLWYKMSGKDRQKAREHIAPYAQSLVKTCKFCGEPIAKGETHEDGCGWPPMFRKDQKILLDSLKDRT